MDAIKILAIVGGSIMGFIALIIAIAYCLRYYIDSNANQKKSNNSKRKK